MTADITFRPITDDDLEFLCGLYASTREEELKPVPWSDAEKANFLRMQFHAQHVHYQNAFADAQYLIILSGEELIGRLYLHRRDDEHRVVDIALLPAHRGRGLGTRILRDIQHEAAAAGKPVRIHVEMFNPAMHFYERLGFHRIADRGAYYLMEWTPDHTA
ncbi:MAG: GNAT family N-acetyltransferase [Planctomycetota bacterium]